MARSDPQLNCRMRADIIDRIRETSRISGISITKLVSYYLEKSFTEAGIMDPSERTVTLPEEIQKLVNVPAIPESNMRTISISNTDAHSRELQEHLAQASYHMDQARRIAHHMATEKSVVFSEQTLIEKLISD